MGIRDFFWKVSDFLSVANPKPFNVIASRDGKLYEVRDHVIGRLVTEKKLIHELEQVNPGFEFQLPKIPNELLRTTLSLFKHYVSQGLDHEVMVQIFWDQTNKQYVLECPYQTVSKMSVHVNDYPIINSSRYVQVMQIHSHNTMNAFFSTVDDEDEKAFMLYGVIGKLDQPEAEMKVRAGCNGEFINLPIDYIFAEPSLVCLDGQFPSEWLQRIDTMSGRRID